MIFTSLPNPRNICSENWQVLSVEQLYFLEWDAALMSSNRDFLFLAVFMINKRTILTFSMISQCSTFCHMPNQTGKRCRFRTWRARFIQNRISNFKPSKEENTILWSGQELSFKFSTSRSLPTGINWTTLQRMWFCSEDTGRISSDHIQCLHTTTMR